MFQFLAFSKGKLLTTSESQPEFPPALSEADTRRMVDTFMLALKQIPFRQKGYQIIVTNDSGQIVAVENPKTRLLAWVS